VLAGLVAGLLAHAEPAAALGLAAALGALAGRFLLGCACVLATLGGAIVADARLAAIDRTTLGPRLGEHVSVRAVQLEPPRPRRFGARVALVQIRSDPGRGERVVLRAGRDLRWPRVEPGRIVAARGDLVALPGHEAHWRRRGARAMLRAEAIAPTAARRGGLAGALDRLRARAEAEVSAGLPPPLGALALGMVLGRDEGLPEPVREDFRRSGLAHLLAASGQNVMLLAALAVALLAAAGVGLRGRLAGALVLIALYVPIAGAGPSVQRAGVMGAAALVAALAGRPTSRWYALLLAAALTLAANPRAAADPGWQLSFAAVAGIAALSGRWSAALAARGAPRALAAALAVTAAATVATAPLLAFHFERVSLVSLPANLLAAAAVAPVMWLGMLSIGLGLALPGVDGPLNPAARLPLAYLAWLAHAAGALPGATATIALGSPGDLAAAYLALGGLLAAASRLRGRRVAAALVAAGALAAGWGGGRGTAPPPDPRLLVVSFLDVGQGDATLVQHGGATVLVDTGPPGSPLLARLAEAGVRRVDLLVVTHAQADHDGGAAAVLGRLPVGMLLDGGDGRPTAQQRRVRALARRGGVPRLTPDAGQSLRIGPVGLRVLWPAREPADRHAGEDPNLRAIVAHLRVGDFDLLLPADAESEVTTQLDLPAVEALKVAHHGSADPGLPDLLARVRPRLAVIEVGERNQHGHPAPETLAALRSVPGVYRTDRHGTVRLTVADGRMAVATEP
jgi:competence protein ComEC